VTAPVLRNAGGEESGLLMQQLEFRFRQQFTRLFEVGSSQLQYVGGRTDGDVNVRRTIARRTIAKAFYLAYGLPGTFCSNDLRFSVMREPLQSGPTAYTTGSVRIAALPVCLTMADIAVNESMSLVFAAFSAEESPPQYSDRRP
jgi:hypothetical protein